MSFGIMSSLIDAQANKRITAQNRGCYSSNNEQGYLIVAANKTNLSMVELAQDMSIMLADTLRDAISYTPH